MPEFSLTTEQRMRASKLMRKHSITYWTATQSFPMPLRDKVITIYQWVREADELVDNPITDPHTALKEFQQIFEKTWKTNHGPESHQLFVQLAKTAGFEKTWCDAFLNSMEQDLTVQTYKDWKSLDRYVYGSADVIGLMMAKILNVPAEAFPAAQALGRWMQYVNFLRDIDEDWNDRHRIYIPLSVLEKHHFSAKKFGPQITSSSDWLPLVQEYEDRLAEIKKLAVTGIPHLPRWAQFPVYFATVLYQWALDGILLHPEIVWKKSLKPTPQIIVKLFPKAWLAFWRQNYS